MSSELFLNRHDCDACGEVRKTRRSPSHCMGKGARNVAEAGLGLPDHAAREYSCLSHVIVCGGFVTVGRPAEPAPLEKVGKQLLHTLDAR